jgi:hypothetical protein
LGKCRCYNGATDAEIMLEDTDWWKCLWLESVFQGGHHVGWECRHDILEQLRGGGM